MSRRLTVGFSGSGGAGKMPSPKNYFAGSRRIPSAAKPLSAANGVGRLPLLEQDTHARKRSFLNWQGVDDIATLHDFYSTTPGKVQPPEHPLTFSLFAGKAMTRQVAFACNIARPQARDTPRSGHPAPTSLPCQPSRFHLPAPHQANPPSAQHSAREQKRAETARQGSLTITFTARKSPVQATSHARQPIHQPQHLPFFKVHSICAQRLALPACGRAWILFGSRKNSKRGKCLKMPQTPTRRVHALLGVLVFGEINCVWFSKLFKLSLFAFSFLSDIVHIGPQVLKIMPILQE